MGIEIFSELWKTWDLRFYFGYLENLGLEIPLPMFGNIEDSYVFPVAKGVNSPYNNGKVLYGK